MFKKYLTGIQNDGTMLNKSGMLLMSLVTTCSREQTQFTKCQLLKHYMCIQACESSAGYIPLRLT